MQELLAHAHFSLCSRGKLGDLFFTLSYLHELVNLECSLPMILLNRGARPLESLLLIRERFPDCNLTCLLCMISAVSTTTFCGLVLHMTTARSLVSLANGSMLPDQVAT